ncbi:stage III sporulation protein AH [Siminovitchia terrae]|uniref:SpoIIIAH-like family protein n=1 Tax=Siminovitchia terrae TaxID=1914933 RepID=A0A429XDH0_SIMTE|nr:SpoIIIAH-like family protein [Siminovitchia terrae]RST61409.1 SpoIIIAH-like family protein [Siminovitchia terrae]GIN89577.1 stage III sporulation protein AH [Siminovitchia terrae]GIN96397.1 stage III sporulation protein AH [Siminovitchia terrae]
MLLKKQTVWLLTMLSLVVVLSVYYVTSDPAKKDFATGGKEETSGETATNEKDMKVITEASGDEAFETIRLEIQDKRSKEITDLTSQVGSPDLTAKEKNELYTKMQDLTALETKEKTLESLIKSLGYDDALVRTDNNEMLITVIAKEHSKADAARILQVVREEIGTQTVATVEFQTK